MPDLATADISENPNVSGRGDSTGRAVEVEGIRDSRGEACGIGFRASSMFRGIEDMEFEIQEQVCFDPVLKDGGWRMKTEIENLPSLTGTAAT